MVLNTFNFDISTLKERFCFKYLKIFLDAGLKLILLNYQNNYVEYSS